MALKDLLVHVDQTPGAQLRLHMAADLAHRHGSRLTALFVRQLDGSQLHDQSTAEFGLVSAADINRSNRQIVEAGHATEDYLVRELAAIKGDSGLEVEFKSVAGSAATVVPQHARFADLCLAGQDANRDAAPGDYSFSEAILFGSGRPVLLVPEGGTFESLGRHVLVAWNSSRASARSLNDALPLIERAERTTILAMNAAEYVKRYKALPPQQIVEHVRRHSPSVEALQLDAVAGESIAQVIQDQAIRVGADMVVAGAFGHPTLWEKLLGGVTRTLLSRMALPVLMSH